MIFYSKHVRVLGKSRRCFSKKSYVFFPNHAIGNKGVSRNLQYAPLNYDEESWSFFDNIYPTPFTASIESVVSFSNNLRKREMLLFRLS